ncbi:MAG: hypothetical protein ABIS28_03020 [Caldimonas sp.]
MTPLSKPPRRAASRVPAPETRLPLVFANRTMRAITTLHLEAASGEWVFDPVLPSPWQTHRRSTESFSHEPTRHARRLPGLRMGIVDLR